ncbi:low molecular weight phosphatase family protein [Polycladidibacter stylochi]|uniref:arsenate-mycothiol transferase ArsC n=1 Tax=Polycladidibacter stylochi TaxID=1807766 RepID=UPI00082B225B|nr:hypothetical protein [Pseudovibrio stylochi]
MQATNLLFVCQTNAFLSLLAEAYCNSIAGPEIRAFSAGPAPASAISKSAKKILFEQGLSEAGLEPKSWDIFALPHAPQPDFLVTLQITNEILLQPNWQVAPKVVHWQLNLNQFDGGSKMTKANATKLFNYISATIDRSLAAGFFSNYMARPPFDLKNIA